MRTRRHRSRQHESQCTHLRVSEVAQPHEQHGHVHQGNGRGAKGNGYGRIGRDDGPVAGDRIHAGYGSCGGCHGPAVPPVRRSAASVCRIGVHRGGVACGVVSARLRLACDGPPRSSGGHGYFYSAHDECYLGDGALASTGNVSRYRQWDDRLGAGICSDGDGRDGGCVGVAQRVYRTTCRLGAHWLLGRDSSK